MNNDYFNDNKLRMGYLRAYKSIFSGTIKESFLVEMINNVESDPRYAARYFQTLDINKALSFETIAVGQKPHYLDLTKMIVMAHYFRTGLLSEAEKGKCQNDINYKKDLVNEVLSMYQIEKYATPFFNNSSLEAFLPLIYYISAINNYCGIKYDEMVNKKLISNKYNERFNNQMLYKILTKIRACVNLTDIWAVDELMVVFRTLIESFMVYLVLWDQKDGVIDSFFEFDSASFEYNYNGEIPDDMKFMAEDQGANKLNFVNYGWIKNLEEFKHVSNKLKAYNLGGLAQIINIKYSDFIEDWGDNLYKLFKSCNPQTHATTQVMNYYQIELYVFNTIGDILRVICDIMSKSLFSFDFKVDGVDLIEELKACMDKSIKLSEELSHNEKLLAKTNKDYYFRTICGIKMRQ